VLWKDVIDCPDIVWRTRVVIVGPLVAVFFIMCRLASLERVRMAFDTLLRTGCDETAMQTKGDATYSLLGELLLSLGVSKMITLLLCR
jgi:hypothetical protein